MRLGELTRVANKHLLPVGRWPMIYYPLQLLQLCGIREVLIVAGQGHAGQLIDLLRDGRMKERNADLLQLFDLDLTYKVQTEAGGIAQVVGMAESFAAGAVVMLRATMAFVDALRAVGAKPPWIRLSIERRPPALGLAAVRSSSRNCCHSGVSGQRAAQHRRDVLGLQSILIELDDSVSHPWRERSMPPPIVEDRTIPKCRKSRYSDSLAALGSPDIQPSDVTKATR